MDAGREKQPADRPEQRKFVRRKYLIDPSTQLRFGFILMTVVMGGAAGLAGLWVLGSSFVTESDPSIDPAASGRLVWWIDAAYFVFTLVAMLIIGIRFTHRFVGPALVLERALGAMCDGDLAPRLELRRRDKLVNVAQAAERLARKLRIEKGWLDRFASDLEEGAKRGDVEAVRAQAALLRSFVEGGVPGGQPAAATHPVASRE